MSTSNGSGRGWRGGRRIVPLAVLAAACGVVLFGSAGTASASSVICGGSVEPLNKKKPGVDAELEFTCTETIRGFSVLTNKTFDFFGTEEEVYNPDGSGSPQSATIQCEGNVPSPGFGCGVPNRNTPSSCEAVSNSGAPTQSVGPPCASEVSGGNLQKILVGFPTSPCKPTGQFAPGKDKLRVWLNVLTEPLISAFDTTPPLAPEDTTLTRGTYISQPFRLSTKHLTNCASDGASKPKKAKKKNASLSDAIDRVLSWL